MKLFSRPFVPLTQAARITEEGKQRHLTAEGAEIAEEGIIFSLKIHKP